MKNTLKRTAIVVLGLGLTAASDAFALENGSFDNGGLLNGKVGNGILKANHPGALAGKVGERPFNSPASFRNNQSFNNQKFNHSTFNNNQFANYNGQHAFNPSKNTFMQQHPSFNANNNVKNFANNNPQFIHSTPSFNNVNKDNVVVANNFNHAVTFNNVNNKIIQTGNTTTHIVSNGVSTNTVFRTTTTTQHIGPQNGNVVMQVPNHVIVNPANKPIIASGGARPIIVNKPVTINNWGRPYGYHYGYNNYGYHHYYYGPPIIIAPYPYYNNGYYNNNVNDFLAIALGLSLIGNVAQFAAAQSHNTTNTVVYQGYPPYAANSMSVYQPVPYAPAAYSSTGGKSGSNSSTSSQPVNVTVNTTVNTTTPAATPNGPTTTTSTQSTTTATPQTTADATQAARVDTTVAANDAQTAPNAVNSGSSAIAESAGSLTA